MGVGGERDIILKTFSSWGDPEDSVYYILSRHYLITC